MAVETNFGRMLEEDLKLEGPWLPPRPWESIPTESGRSTQSRISFCDASSSSSNYFYDTSALSEACIVRLGMNALQGVESALLRIEKLAATFCLDPADRTFHRIPTLWTRASSTHALGKILKSLWVSGSSVFLLCKFVNHFTNFNHDGDLTRNELVNSELEENRDNGDNKLGEHPPYSLVNQAFAIAVGKVLDGYICALDTLGASVGLRRLSKSADLSFHESSGGGCLTNVVHNEITLLELYAHTKELRTQIQALGNMCNINVMALGFSALSLEDMTKQAKSDFRNFPRAGDLLTYIYSKLELADPAHSALLKFLFLRSCEPYCSFMRSWIYEAKISDPYKEFIVDCMENLPRYSHGKAGIVVDFPLTTVRERDEVAVPCFLKNFSTPLFRAGQQLQILKKLLELCNLETPDCTYEDIIPCWGGFSNDHPTAFQLTFNKRNIEAVVIARSIFYESLQKKLENIVIKLEVRYHQVIPHGTISGESPDISNLFAWDSFTATNMETIAANGTADAESCSSADEFSYLEDSWESSDCSSLSSCEEESESEKLFEIPRSMAGLEQQHLSALNVFSTGPICNSSELPPQFEQSVEVTLESCENKDSLAQDCHPNHFKETYFDGNSMSLPSGDPVDLWMPETLHSDTYPDTGRLFDILASDPFHIDRRHDDGIDSHPSEVGLIFKKKTMGALKKDGSYFSKMIASKECLLEEAPDKYEKVHGFSDKFTSKSWKLRYHSNFLSMNPMLTKTSQFHNMSKHGEKCSTYNSKLLPCHNFSFVEDPFKICVENLPSSPGHGLGSELPVVMGFGASAANIVSSLCDRGGHDIGSTLTDKTKISRTPPFNSKHHNQDIRLSDVSGGSGWERLLASSVQMVNANGGNQKKNLESEFEIPLHFIIKECLQQEIMLQYQYVSKLTIKFLDEGFNLQEHLLALRRYHLMEVADWADLFIMSIWHHKWCLAEADKRISEIQGLLELSIQRSSCERDDYKDRLFVFMKGQAIAPFSTSSIGVHSFDFLGLGYRVDWPISIVLTPEALRIYSQIFNFLLQVKLAVFALTHVWCSLKDSVHIIRQNCRFSPNIPEARHFNMLMKLRHQLNHFVSTLQQYVLSQLTHVSWCRFLQSLKHKVKDMMDFELVHMAYLTDSLRICFLSDGIPSVGSIIESILQCALDFRFCLIGGTWGVEQDQADSSSKFSINISQVLSIKKIFDNSLKELYLCYLKSPKHGEFGLAHFWGYLNYNEFYVNALGNEMVQYAFSV